MKIDIVYTWVDGSDPVWNEKRINKLREIQNISSEDSNKARFMDNQELRYSLRSISKFAPWVNKIYIVTDNQSPTWLDTSHPKIKIVDHKDIFPSESYLPNFSSCAIEAQIQNIADLSEYFIYFNDDMFLGSPTIPEYFFDNEGGPKVFVSEIFPLRKKKSFDIKYRAHSKRNSHHNQIINTRKLLRDKFEKSIYYNIRHGIIPLRKSILKEIGNIFEKEIQVTSKKSFRNQDDIIIFYLFGFYSIMTKKGKAKYLKSIGSKEPLINFSKLFKNKFTFGFVNLDSNNVLQHLENFLMYKPLIMCLNQTPDTSEEKLNYLKEFLEKYYPEKCPFEID